MNTSWALLPRRATSFQPPVIGVETRSRSSGARPFTRAITAGVIVFDREGRIDTVNPGATRILRLPLSARRGRRLAERSVQRAQLRGGQHALEAQLPPMPPRR